MLHIFSYTYLNVAPGTFSNQNNGITLDTFLYVNVNVKRTSNYFKCFSMNVILDGTLYEVAMSEVEMANALYQILRNDHSL